MGVPCDLEVVIYTLNSILPYSKGLPIWGSPKIRDTILGVLITRIIVFWGPYWGPLIFWETTICTPHKIPSR